MNQTTDQPYDPSIGRTVNPVLYFSSERSGYPSRTTTNVEPLVCGEEAFAAVSRALKAATKSINMCFWGLDPCMILNRGRANNIWDTSDMLGEILIKKARDENVQVRIVVWDHYKAGIGSGGSGSDDLIDADLGGNNANLDAFHDIADEIPNLEVKMTNAWGAPNSLFPSFHQKTIIVDVEDPPRATAFVMGHNMLWPYWSTKSLLPTNPRRDFAVRIVGPGKGMLRGNIAALEERLPLANPGHDQLRIRSLIEAAQGQMAAAPDTFFAYREEPASLKPYLDISTQIWGGGVADVYENFHRVWELNFGQATPAPGSPLIAPYLMGNMSNLPLTQAQMGATFNAPRKRAIRDFYLNAISQADRYVLFVNQYFRHWTLSEEIVRALESRGIPDEKPVPIIVVTNDWNGSGAQQGHDGEALEIFTDKGHPISMCKLATRQAASAGFGPRKSIYIHAKLLIVDDVFYTIGSANYNWRSLDGDPEYNVAVHDDGQARQLRREIMNILIGDPMEGLMTGDPMVAYNDWVNKVTANDLSYPTPNALPNGRAISYGPDTNNRFYIPNRLVNNGSQTEFENAVT